MLLSWPSLSLLNRFSARRCNGIPHFFSKFQSTGACSPAHRGPFETSLKVYEFENTKNIIPSYRVLDEQGIPFDESQIPKLSDEILVKMQKQMITNSVMDGILYDAQRQGRISFYMTSYGEEATHVGSAAALSLDDIIFLQYREAGVLMWRGFSIDDCVNQCCSNHLDPGKGRQMPVHYGSVKLNVQTISSPLTTQLPHASGAAYAQKLLGKKAITAVYFGEGAASEGDFHAALNFAATLEAPVVFFCRNNGFAISTSTHEQFRGDGIASRGAGYGIDTIRVDGNCLFSVYNAMSEAKKRALNNRPVLVEAMTYRVGHHSTSDDSTHYRSAEDVQQWVDGNNPISRFGLYLRSKSLWNDEQEKTHRLEVRKQVLASLNRSEKEPKPAIHELFSDVYDEIPAHLQEQRSALAAHLELHGQQYNLNEFKN